MRIAIVIPTIEAGGAEKQAVILAQCLAKKHEVFFFVFWGNLPQEQKHLDSLRSSNVNLFSLEGSTWKKTRILAQLLKENRINAAFNFLTMCDGAGCLAERKAGVSIIYNGIRSSRLAWWKEQIEKYCNNHWVTGTIFNSYCAADYFGERGFRKDRLLVIQNCFPKIDLPEVREESDVKTIITVGRFDAAKDYETSIKTVAETVKRYPQLRYVIVGHGSLESNVRNWVRQYGIEGITQIMINPSNIPDLLREADIFLTTSLYEGTSNAVMEALNASLPVVCTRVGDNAYLVKDGKSGFVHLVGDYKSMSESLVKLLENYQLRTSFGRAANQNLRNNFSVESFSNHYFDLLKQEVE